MNNGRTKNVDFKIFEPRNVLSYDFFMILIQESL